MIDFSKPLNKNQIKDSNPMTLEERAEQVYASLAIENMAPDEEFMHEIQKVIDGKLTIEELRQKVLRNEA